MENRNFDRKRAGGAFAVAWNRLLNQAKLEGLLQRKPVDLSKGEQLQGQGVVFPLTEDEIQLLTAAQSKAMEATP